MGEAVSKNFNKYVDYSAHAPWKLKVEPFRVAPAVYYVGNEWVGAFLIDTRTEGLILIDACMFENVYLTIEMIRELGFDPKDISHIMLTHCHMDHTGGVKALQELSGAKIWMSAQDDRFKDEPANYELNLDFFVPPYEVDMHYDDSNPMQFGDVTIQTVLTPGHTPGTTSFFITSPDEKGTMLTSAIHGGVGPMTMKKEYLEKYGLPLTLPQQFIDGCEKLKTYHVDIAIPSHPAHGNLFTRKGKNSMDYKELIDENQWQEFLETRIQFIKEML